VGSIQDLEDMIWNIESTAGGSVEREEGGIDVVAVCHEFTDHCHRETLEMVGRDVPVFATKVYTFGLDSFFPNKYLQDIKLRKQRT
jgi:L-ascorbate metabolism protein UlaG (beta-lactamase superfamily)